MFKRLIALVLVSALLSGCTLPAAPGATEPSPTTVGTLAPETQPTEPAPSTVPETEPAPTEALTAADLTNPLVLTQLEETIYSDLVLELDSTEYFVEDVQVIYISTEYLQEVAFNSQSNVYFGYTLEELNAQFSGTKYVFTLGENGTTLVQEFQEYENPYNPVIRDLVIGTGILLVSVTVSVALSGNPVTLSTIFAAAVEYGKGPALAGIGAFAAALIQNHKSDKESSDWNAVLQNAALTGGATFKGSVVKSVVKETGNTALGLLTATLNGLSQKEAAQVQQESGLPQEFISSFHSQEEYQVYRDAGLSAGKVNGQWAFIRNIDWAFTDSQGRTNAQRVREGLSPLDPTGESYELHHIGQLTTSPLAILTSREHESNYSILHTNTGQTQGQQPSQGSEWTQQRRDFWKALLDMSGFTD